MLSKGLCLGSILADLESAASSSPSRPQNTQTATDPLLALAAVGICVLVVWIVRRLANPQKLTLRNTPGRANCLTPAHIMLPLMVYLAPLAVLGQIAPQLGQGTALMVTTAAQSVSAVLCLVVAGFTFRGGLGRGLGLSMRHWIYDTGRGVLGFMAILPICLALAHMLPRSEQDLHPLLKLLPEAHLPLVAAIVLSAVIIAPLAEELFFRGLLQSMLRKYLTSPWAAILASSVVFVLLHAPQWKDMPALFALSIALGYNYERCGRLYPSILIHAIFNAVNVAARL